ncbi:hypothetical protein niasHT_008293 [Heterodera trifolii]|uniref:Uncharacterized protein n=1 Tax=Heterodera trifolii TaxID=157864 RepID=A0ABD2M1G7_9BILA
MIKSLQKALKKRWAKQIEAVKNDLVPELEVVINEKKLENAGVKSTNLLFELADLQRKTEMKRQKNDENLDQTLPRFCRNDQKSAKSTKKEPTKSFLKGLAKQIEAVKNDLVPELEVVINEKKLENAGVKSTNLLFELAELQRKIETKRQKNDEIGREISQNLVHLNEDRAKKKALKDAIQQNAKSTKKQMENIGKMLKKIIKNYNSKKMGASASN